MKSILWKLLIAILAYAITHFLLPTPAISYSSNIDEFPPFPVNLTQGSALGGYPPPLTRIAPDLPYNLEQVRFCESEDIHFNPDGSVLRGRENPLDVGLMQINLYYHADEARRMGLDLFDPIDNQIFALHLYEREGLAPWSASQNCWISKVL